MDKILLKIFEDIDSDIVEFLLSDSDTPTSYTMGKPVAFYKNWQLMSEPDVTVLRWQTLRNKKHG